MKKILLTGADGMLAYDFIRTQGVHFEVVGLGKAELNITDAHQVEQKILEIRPDLILNCAAYTNVEEAEESGKKMNFEVNVLGVFHLAKVAREQNIDLITISTDYVFDGTKTDGYSENDTPNPINSYGLAKYLGERISQETHPSAIIIRTSWLYGGGKEFKNFANTMLKLSETRDELKVINDQFGLPTYTVDLSDALRKIIENIESFRGKILHLSSENNTHKRISWYDFAKEIYKIAGKVNIKISSCSSEEYMTKAKRPEFSILRNTTDIKLPFWKESLAQYISSK